MFRCFIFIFLLFSPVLFSCIGGSYYGNVNEDFKKKFGSNVAEINANRSSISQENSIKPSINNELQNQLPHDQFARVEEILKIGAPVQYSSAFVTIKPKKNNSENFVKNTDSANKYPDDLFDLNYNLGLNGSFSSSGLEFDNIEIPSYDYHGVASSLNKKKYLLAGNKVLQEDVNNLLRQRNSEDIEISKILIKEKSDLKKKQKLRKIFGDDSAVLKEDKVIKKDENNNSKNSLDEQNLIERQIQKAIALQVIRRNISQNNASNKSSSNKPNQAVNQGVSR